MRVVMCKSERVNSPLDSFEIYSVVDVNVRLLNVYIPLTNMTLVYIVIVIVVLIIYMVSYRPERSIDSSVSVRNYKEGVEYIRYVLKEGSIGLVSNKWINMGDVIYYSVLNMVISQIEGRLVGQKYFPLLLCLFSLTLVSNLMGLVTYGYAVSANFGYCFFISITVICSVTILGFYIHKWKFIGLMVPTGTPLILVPLLTMIEFISYLARAVSLGLRLAANILAGHILISILCGFIYGFIILGVWAIMIGILPIIVVVMIIILEFAICGIQSYILSVLTASYIKDAELLH